MKILVVTPYTGSESLVRMTEAMLASLREIISYGLHGMEGIGKLEFGVVAINNAAVRPVRTELTWHGHMDKNEGFGVAVNLAIKREIFDMEKAGLPTNYTHVLVLNNDLEFPDPNWLRELLLAVEGDLVLSPCTDVTATKCAVATEARDLDPIRAPQVSAFCWLVPVTTINKMRRKFTFPLFHPDFSNYGSDDVTGSIFRSMISKQPFKVVPRSWVRHLKARTANELGVKAGEPELLRRIANFKRARRLS